MRLKTLVNASVNLLSKKFNSAIRVRFFKEEDSVNFKQETRTKIFKAKNYDSIIKKPPPSFGKLEQ